MFVALEELRSCVSVITGAEVGDLVCGGVMGDMALWVSVGMTPGGWEMRIS